MFKVRKPYDQYFKTLTKHDEVEVNDKTTGLYFLRLTKNLGVGDVRMDRIRHNHWMLRRIRPLKKSRENTKYSIFC